MQPARSSLARAPASSACRPAGEQQQQAAPRAPPAPPPAPVPPRPLPTTRRTAHAALLAAGLAAWACRPPPHAAAAGLDKYVRKRKLDPLASYVPPVLDARAQLARLPAAYGDAKDARRLLRSGAFEGLRDNVRAIGEYAAAAAAAAAATTAAGTGTAAPPQPRLAADFFTALESLDGVLYRAVRDGGPVPVADADARLAAALAALDRLLATVPGDVLDGAKRVVGVGSGGGLATAADKGGGGATPPTAALSEILPGGAGAP